MYRCREELLALCVWRLRFGNATALRRGPTGHRIGGNGRTAFRQRLRCDTLASRAAFDLVADPIDLCGQRLVFLQLVAEELRCEARLALDAARGQ